MSYLAMRSTHKFIPTRTGSQSNRSSTEANRLHIPLGATNVKCLLQANAVRRLGERTLLGSTFLVSMEPVGNYTDPDVSGEQTVNEGILRVRVTRSVFFLPLKQNE